MKAFARHAGRCPTCVNPYEVHRRGGTLCPKGHQRALDVAQYVYNKGGQAYSAVDREGSQRVQIEIPVGCEAVRSLLKAMERGLRLMKRAPVSYDANYYVPPRPVIHHERSYVRKPRLETAEPPAWAVNGRTSRHPSSGGKGSLYESEMRERERSYKPTVYYKVKSQSGPPVPPKDYYYHR